MPVRPLDLELHGLPGSIVSSLLAPGAVDASAIPDEAISNNHINTAAAIAQSKIASLTTDLSARPTKAGTETINGTWTFSNPVTVATAVSSGQAVTLGQLNSAIAGFASSLHAPVQTLVALEALTDYTDKQLILVEDTGANYRFDAQSLAVTDGTSVVRPDDIASDASPGRWVKQFIIASDTVTLGSTQTVTGTKTFSAALTTFTQDVAVDGTLTVDTLTATTITGQLFPYEVSLIDAAGGETTLAKNGGDPAIPDDDEHTQVFIDGQQVFRGSGNQFTVDVGGGAITFSALVAGQDVRILYWA